MPYTISFTVDDAVSEAAKAFNLGTQAKGGAPIV